MLKYSWAQQGMLYELSEKDIQMAEFIAKNGPEDYQKLKLKYDELFNPKVPHLTSDKLW